MESLAIMRDAGLPMAFGSDLLGGLMKYHSMEFEILARVAHAGGDHRLGHHRRRKDSAGWRARSASIAPGAFADLIVVDGDPYADITLLAQRRRAHAGDHGARAVPEE